MTRVRRIIFAALTFLSVLLLIGTVTLWVRTRWVDEDLFYSLPAFGKLWQVEAASGSSRMIFEWHVLPDTRDEGVGLVGFWWTVFPPGTTTDMTLGFGPSDVEPGGKLGVPDWAAVIAFALLPLWATIRIIPGRTKKRCCLRCGYDLTGNISGICPECGNQIARTGC